MAISLLGLPGELLNNILSYLQADALLTFGQTCSEAHRFINANGNSTLWKHTFLNTYDAPISWSTTAGAPAVPNKADRDARPEDQWDYYSHLRQRTMIVRLIKGEEVDLKDDHSEAVRTILSIIDTARPRSGPEMPSSLNLDVLANLGGQRNLDRIILARQMEPLGQIPSVSPLVSSGWFPSVKFD